MGKLIWKGWQKDASNAPTPTGPGITRTGELIISLAPSHLELARKLAEYHREVTAKPPKRKRRAPGPKEKK